MTQRISIPVTIPEREALIKLSQIERRDPRDQAALLIRQALEQAGYLLPQGCEDARRGLEVSA